MYLTLFLRQLTKKFGYSNAFVILVFEDNETILSHLM